MILKVASPPNSNFAVCISFTRTYVGVFHDIILIISGTTKLTDESDQEDDNHHHNGNNEDSAQDYEGNFE